MAQHPINDMMNTTLAKIKEMIDVNTIIGEPIIAPDGSMIIPVSKVSYGFASGGSDLPTKYTKDAVEFFGGGSGAGVSINPIAFLYVSNGNVKLLNIENNDGVAEKLVGMAPETIQKIVNIFKSEKKDENFDGQIEDPLI